MQLKLQRSQREGGVIGKHAIFCVDARAQLTPQEQASVKKYDLGRLIIYSSEAAKRSLANRDANMELSRSWDAKTSAVGTLKMLGHHAIAAFQLNISIDSLQRGQHIECKSLDEVLGAEEALTSACQTMKVYLDTAATFDGREVLIDFSGGEPEITATASTPDPMLVAPYVEPLPREKPISERPLLLGGDAPAPVDDRFGYGDDTSGLPPHAPIPEVLPADTGFIVAPIVPKRPKRDRWGEDG